MTRILLLGGTTEANLMAKAIADAGLAGVYSYAGRTEAPMGQPIHMRMGGFGGVEGLRTYLVDQAITHVIDATHPFAAQMSANAVAACTATGTPLIALERAPWVAGEGDRWTHVPDIPAAVTALAGPPQRVFLAIGRQHLEPFAGQPQHHYLLRLVDPPTTPLPLPQAQVVVARGPFDVAGDTALLQSHATQVVVAKNAGGKGAVAKIAAARALGLPVLMIDRPQIPPRPVARSVKDVMAWLG
ncbi:cobalt-precorrin-6A reductase [Tabrizicola piscis]|uniref:Cobalt-precorrin-6A reductase n=1 Tax=Tabrizicola piscis TaxID=2494374 RepID=A0A3S8U7Q7_9RHOB|nr:cobalt-precorrin-6A reductase [Tabrizicola piscis]AZL59634.1 cobalt-precorrin-6A reductase [Tabrizicola piscis]